MKNKFNLAKLSLIALITATIFVACKKDEEAPYVDKGAFYFTGNATADQMVPAPTNPSTGTAVFFARFDNNSKVFNYSVKWTNLSGIMTSASFYFPSDATQNGVLARSIASGQTRAVTDSLAGQIWGNNSLSDQELSDLKAGKVYYTISTQMNTGGELRGQITLNK
jgi:hypothetical protein